ASPPQVLFIERCIQLLAPGGCLGMVVPESVLSNPSYRHVVQYVMERTTPFAIVGMPEALFKTTGRSGTHTKVCLIVLKKGVPKSQHRVFMAEAKWCGHDSRGRKIPLNDIPKIVETFKEFREGKEIVPSRFGFAFNLGELKNQVLAPRYYDPEVAQLLLRLQRTHNLVKVADLV